MRTSLAKTNSPATVPESEGKLQQDVNDLEEITKLDGKTGSDPEKDGLMHSVLEHDDQDIKDGRLLAESYDNNLNSFQPDLLFDQLCKNYKQAKKLLGETLIRELTGYDGSFVEKNVNIPEFREELKQRINQQIDEMRKKGLIDEDGKTTEQGVRLASLVRYTEELERITNKGYGEEHKERGVYGERAELEPFKNHRFGDINIRATVRKAARRGHKKILREDLVANERKEHANVTIIYALDASGSMRGGKLTMAKRAGVALAYQAINDKNEVGLIVFTSKIEKVLPPSRDFIRILDSLTTVRAGLETDIALTIEEAINLFGKKRGTKHLVLLTDALPTKSSKGKAPQRKVLEAVSSARQERITISLVGINLDEEGERLARKMTEIGNGKLYLAKHAEEIDGIILEDYASIR